MTVLLTPSGFLPTEGSSMLITSEYVQSGGRGRLTLLNYNLLSVLYVNTWLEALTANHTTIEIVKR